MDNEGAKVLSVLLVLYSASSVIQTSIIWMQKFHKPNPHLQNPSGSWRLQNLAKSCFPIVKATRSAENALIIEEKLDICKFMPRDGSYTEHYGSRRSTTVTKIDKENGWHAFEDRCAAQVRWALYFWFGLATEWKSHACYQADVDSALSWLWRNSFKASIIMICVNFWTNITYPNKFTYLNTSQVYQKQRCSDNRGCTVRGELTHSAKCVLLCVLWVNSLLCECICT